MRDPNRIFRILARISEIWARPGNTDLRLGQLLLNAMIKSGKSEQQLYFLEDDELERILREAYGPSQSEQT